MTRALPRNHPDIFTFVQWMIDEENLTRGVAEQIDAGRNVNEGNRRYASINARIMTITGEFVVGDRSRGRFMKGCSINLAELPQPQVVADGVAQENQGGVVHEFNWGIFDHVEGLDFFAPAPPVWQPWLWQPWL
jgi:hypothetical protein